MPYSITVSYGPGAGVSQSCTYDLTLALKYAVKLCTPKNGVIESIAIRELTPDYKALRNGYKFVVRAESIK